MAGAADDLTAVRNHTDQMLCLLAEERPAGGASDSPGLKTTLSNLPDAMCRLSNTSVICKAFYAASSAE